MATGTSLWTLTHHVDFAKAFVGLLGHPQAIGDSFHITSDEVLTWNQIHELVGAAAGAQPRLVHVASEAIFAADEQWGRSLLGDKAHSVIFDNTKVKALVPDYVATIPFAQGAREIVAWHDEDPARRVVDERVDALMDELVARHGQGRTAAARESRRASVGFTAGCRSRRAMPAMATPPSRGRRRATRRPTCSSCRASSRTSSTCGSSPGWPVSSSA